MEVRKNQNGFTLIELLLVISMLALFTTFSGMLFSKTTTRNNLAVSGITATNLLRRAQILSRANYRDSAWGVSVVSGSIRLYKGSSFATRDASFDEVAEIASSVNVSGTTEFNFNKVTGIPVTTGTLTFTAPSLSETRIITVNSKGVIL